MLRYFVCFFLCKVEVRIDVSGSKGGVLGVPPPHPICGLGVGGVVLTFLRVSVILAWYVYVAVFPLEVVSIVVLATQAGSELTSICI